MAEIDFEFAETKESQEFFSRNPTFYPAFETLNSLCNKCFGRAYTPTKQLDEIVFGLGQSCRDDFFEILFLAVGGHGVGAMKLVRGLYERAVTLANLIRNPQKAGRFINFAAINERKLANTALKFFSKAEIEKAISTTFAEIESHYLKAKHFFGGKSPSRWDVDFVSMVNTVGGSYPEYYLAAYALPNIQIHASLASAFRVRGLDSRNKADLALALAHGIMMLVIREQNTYFSLGLDGEINQCESQARAAWDPASGAPRLAAVNSP